MQICNFEIPEKELVFQFVRSSGAGGQNVNKVNTKAVLFFHVQNCEAIPDAVKARFLVKWKNKISENGELVVASDRFRTQSKNLEDVLEKLEAMLQVVLKPPKMRRDTKPTRGSVERRIKEKKQRAVHKGNRQVKYS